LQGTHPCECGSAGSPLVFFLRKAQEEHFLDKWHGFSCGSDVHRDSWWNGHCYLYGGSATSVPISSSRHRNV